MAIKVSVVIPSYNRYPQNRMTLYAFEKQTVPSSIFEVILVDGGSSDGTSSFMRAYRPKYSFQYVQFHHHLNRSATRNQGIYRAKGELIIFLDAEVVVRPDFIEKHLRHHRNSDHIVISGAMRGYQLFSTLDSKMSEDQIFQLYEVIKHKAKYLQRCGLSISRPSSHHRKLREFREQKKSPIALLTRREIAKSMYRRLAVPHCWVHMLFEQFGDHLEGFCFPWMLFVTRNVSVKRSLLHRAGLFDENYQGFGHEDFDLGYRLYEQGARFWNDPEIPYYHQEHYTPSEERGYVFIQNVIYFIEKYKKMELKLFVIMGLLQMNNLTIHHTWLEIQQMQNREYQLFQKVYEILERLFDEVIRLIKQQRALSAIAIQSGIDATHPLRIEATQLILAYGHCMKYPYLTQLIQTLLYR